MLDGGDIYQGSVVSSLQMGKPLYVTMGKMDYDAVAVGNHDFDWGFADMVDPDATLLDYEWNGREYSNEVPVTCANLYQNGNRTTATKDYVIVEKTAVSSRSEMVVPMTIMPICFQKFFRASTLTLGGLIILSLAIILLNLFLINQNT